MLLTNASLLLLSLWMGLTLIFGQVQIYDLFIFSFLAGVFHVVDSPLRQVLLFNLVPRSIAPECGGTDTNRMGVNALVRPGYRRISDFVVWTRRQLSGSSRRLRPDRNQHLFNYFPPWQPEKIQRSFFRISKKE